MKVAYAAKALFDGHTTHHNCIVNVEGERVHSIIPASQHSASAKVIQLPGSMVIPGLVDLQVNGGGGIQLNNTPTKIDLLTMLHAHQALGTTSLLPTVITDTPQITQAAISAVQTAITDSIPGVLGIHLEGPHLAVSRKGAHAANLIRAMDNADCDQLISLTTSLPNVLVTLAPESVEPNLIAKLNGAGILVSLGHTNCKYEDAHRAIEHGARLATHCFNAMSGLTGREPGLLGAIFSKPQFAASIIADGFHVTEASLKTALNAKRGSESLLLVSDAMGTVGSDLKSIVLNGRTIYRNEGRLTLKDGTLAGADICLLDAVRYLVTTIGVDLEEAVRMASVYPAKLLGREADVGSLTPGSYADFVALDKGLLVKGVGVHGKLLAGAI